MGDQPSKHLRTGVVDVADGAGIEYQCAHGLLGAQKGAMSCLCPTVDGGKRCRDGVECQGECVTDGAEHEVTAAGPPALGFFVGKCSRFRTTYGCHRVIATGALQAGPVPLDQPPTEICAD